MTTKLEVQFTICDGLAAILGESPFWDHGDFVWWVDITGRKLLKTQLSTRTTRSWPTPETPGFVVLAEDGGPMVGMERGIYAFSQQDERFDLLLAFDGNGQRFNDATVDDTGCLWASTMALDGSRGRGAVHRVTPDLDLQTVIDGLTTPNGLAAGDGRLFVSDSHPEVQAIWMAACDFRTGETGPRAEFVTMTRLAGRPDGAAPGAAGHYWIAGVDGGALYGFSGEGAVAFEVPLPFPAPTKLAFFDGGVAVTGKSEGGHDGRLAIATGVAHPLRGPAIPFWRPCRR